MGLDYIHSMFFQSLCSIFLFFGPCFSYSRDKIDHISDYNVTKKERLQSYFNERNRLQHFLLSEYDRQIPGVFLGDRYGEEPEQLNCNVTLMYANLLSIEERKQSALMIVDLSYDWIDYRLTWNASDFSGIQQIAIVKKDTLWIPDVMPFDVLSFNEILPEDRLNIVISSTGHLSMYTSNVVEFVCHVDLKNFPFDQQKCTLYLTSNFANMEELYLTGKVVKHLTQQSGNGEWEYANMTVSTVAMNYPDYEYQIIEYEFIFIRTTIYYIMLIIIPSFILTVLCLTGLLWECPTQGNYMETLNLGFAAIQAMIFILTLTTQDIPRINQVDKLSQYSMINLGLIAVASITVMCLGKISTLSYKNKKAVLRWFDKSPGKYLHLLLLVTFVGAAVANLLVLAI